MSKHSGKLIGSSRSESERGGTDSATQCASDELVLYIRTYKMLVESMESPGRTSLSTIFSYIWFVSGVTSYLDRKGYVLTWKSMTAESLCRFPVKTTERSNNSTVLHEAHRNQFTIWLPFFSVTQYTCKMSLEVRCHRHRYLIGGLDARFSPFFFYTSCTIITINYELSSVCTAMTSGGGDAIQWAMCILHATQSCVSPEQRSSSVEITPT